VLIAEDVARDVEVEVVLADAETVRELNRLYRGRDEPTDVLSFSALEVAGPPAGFADDAPAPVEFIEAPEATPSLGEVIVCLPVAEAQASAAGRAVAGEVAHLLVHGLLHLLAYDHETPSDSEAMKAREDALLASLGYAGQYAHGH
jgi:probable rRNA maturation factor